MSPRQKSEPLIENDHKLQTLGKKNRKKEGAPGVNASGRTRKADGHGIWQVKKVEGASRTESPNVDTSEHPAMGAKRQASWTQLKARFASPDLESMTWSTALDGKCHQCNQQPWHHSHISSIPFPFSNWGYVGIHVVLLLATDCWPSKKIKSNHALYGNNYKIRLLAYTNRTFSQSPSRAILHGWEHPHFAFSEVECSAKKQDLQIFTAVKPNWFSVVLTCAGPSCLLPQVKSQDCKELSEFSDPSETQRISSSCFWELRERWHWRLNLHHHPGKHSVLLLLIEVGMLWGLTVQLATSFQERTTEHACVWITSQP